MNSPTFRWYYGLLLLFTVLLSRGMQAQQISGLSIFPANPTDEDKISLIVTTDFNQGPCNRINHTVSISCAINVTATYCTAEGPLCTCTDTLPLGKFPAGNYNVDFSLWHSNMLTDTNCSNSLQTDFSQLSFQVIPTLSAANKIFENKQLRFEMFPNPASRQITIKYIIPPGQEKVALLFYNIYFSEFQRTELDPSGGLLNINISNLAEGIYFCRIITDSYKSEMKSISVVK